MAFSTRYIDEYRAEIRLDIGCPGGGSLLWQDTELDRCVQRAVDDLSRHYPLEAVYEHTIVQTVTDESSTAPAAGTWKDLSNKPIEPGTVVVKDSAKTTTYTRDTDYTIDYVNGRYTIIAAGSITAADTLYVSYTKERLGIDISAIISDLIRISGVEYPVDKVPQQAVSYNIWNDFMYIGSKQAGESQERLTDKEHIAIYYEAVQTAPLAAAAPSYPAFLDQVICIGAGAYAMLLKSINTEHQSVAEFATARTALGKVATYLETNSNFNAVDVLEDITTTLHANVVTAAGHADAVLSALTSTVSVSEADLNAIYTEQKKFLIATSGYSDIEAETFLEAGDDYINKVNLGTDVAGKYKEYAEVSVRMADIAGQVGGNLASLAYAESSSFNAIANSMSAVAQSLNAAAASARVLLDNNRSYVEESAGWVAIANGFVQEAIHYVDMARAGMELADRFRLEGNNRLAKFDELLKSRSEYRKRVSSVPLKQPA